MRRLTHFLIVAFALCLLAGCSDRRVIGNGKIKMQDRQLGVFSRLRVAGSFKVDIEQAKKQAVTVTGDSNVIPLVITKVDQGDLIIKMKPNVVFSSKNPITVHVKVKSLEEVISSGSNQVKASKLRGDVLVVNFNGAGSGVFSGTMHQASYKIVGTTRIDAKHLKTKDIVVDLIGVGDMQVYATHLLDINISGVGQVTYFGKPRIKPQIKGTGKVLHGK